MKVKSRSLTIKLKRNKDRRKIANDTARFFLMINF